jgi:hypothetical protein
MALKYPSIPEPTTAPESLRDAILSIKQMLEILTGQRGNPDYRAVLLPELTAGLASIHTHLDALYTAVAAAQATANGAVRFDIGQALTDAQVERAQMNTRLGRATQLASGTNLNDLRTPGLYDGPSLGNSPDGTADWFYVNVQYHSGYALTNAWLVQTAWCLTDSALRVYMRMNTPSGAISGGAWGAWKRYTLV